MKIQLSLFLFLLLSPALWGQSATELIRQADQLMEKKDLKGALQLLDQAIQKAPSKPEAYIFKSSILDQMHAFQDAFDVLGEGIENCERDIDVMHCHRGVLLQKVGQFRESIAEYGIAWDLATSDSVRIMILVNRGATKSNIRDFAGAYSDLRKAYDMDSNDVAVLNNLAATTDEAGHPEETLYLLKRCLALQPDFIGSYVNIGFYYQNKGEYAESIGWFDKAVKMDPNEAFSYNNRSYSKMKLGDLKGALADVQKSIDLYDSNSYAFRNRALIYIEQGKTAKACEDLETAEKLRFSEMYGDEVRKLQSKYCR